MSDLEIFSPPSPKIPPIGYARGEAAPDNPLVGDAIRPYLLQNGFILTDLQLHDFELLQEIARPLPRKRGETLFHEGSFPKGAYWLRSGIVKIYQETPTGQRQTLYIYSAGDLIGFRQLIAGEPNPVSAVVLENASIGFIPTDRFFEMIERSPILARNLFVALAREFTVWMNRMTAFAQLPVRCRLALALLILHEQYRRSGWPGGAITVARNELAEYLGASPETVIRALHTLKTQGLVQITGRRIALPDPAGLVAVLREARV